METIATNHIDAHKNIRSIGIPSSEDMKGLRSNHHRSILKIKEAGRCFLDEYKKRDRLIHQRGIYGRTQKTHISKVDKIIFRRFISEAESGDQNILSNASESAHSFNNSRVTLTAVNHGKKLADSNDTVTQLGLETVVLRRLSSCKIYNSVPEEEQHFNWLQDNAIQMSAVIFTRHINMFVFSHHSQITKRENIENEQWQNTRRCKATV
ncbi:hypothetical protein NC652_017461 [Populus alba x Populus x berolinensis]|nr:hypothetical protein NC652_017461 [Populus alba x Populus x berolinensis]